MSAVAPVTPLVALSLVELSVIVAVAIPTRSFAV